MTSGQCTLYVRNVSRVESITCERVAFGECENSMDELPLACDDTHCSLKIGNLTKIVECVAMTMIMTTVVIDCVKLAFKCFLPELRDYRI